MLNKQREKHKDYDIWRNQYKKDLKCYWLQNNPESSCLLM